MKRQTIALGLALALASSSTAAMAQQQLVHSRWMGDATCGGWRAAPADFNQLQKAALLNWVLGFLSARAEPGVKDVLADVQVSSIAAWIDNYCAANPLDYLVTAAFELEKALIARRESGRG